MMCSRSGLLLMIVAADILIFQMRHYAA